MSPWAWWRRTFFGGLRWCAVNGALLLFTVAAAVAVAYAVLVAAASALIERHAP